MRSFAIISAVSAGCFSSQTALGQATVELDLNPDAVRILQTAGYSPEALRMLVEEELTAIYGLFDVPTYLRLSANAQSMANKGLGVDYASNVDGWALGVGVAVAADAGDSTLDDVEAISDGTERAVPVGAGAQIALMAGYTVADRLTVFANALYYPLDTDDLDGTFYNLGAHVQFKAVRPYGRRALLHWGGLDLTTGFEVSRMFLELNDQFEASGTLVQGLDLDTVSTGTLELEQRAFTIPLEVTTNATLFYFLTLYGGVALDFQLGDASMNFDLDTELATANPQEGGALDLGDARILVDDLAGPDPVMFRVLAGLQLNIWKLKVFGQLNFLTSDLTLGLAAGLRLVI